MSPTWSDMAGGYSDLDKGSQGQKECVAEWVGSVVISAMSFSWLGTFLGGFLVGGKGLILKGAAMELYVCMAFYHVFIMDSRVFLPLNAY